MRSCRRICFGAYVGAALAAIRSASNRLRRHAYERRGSCTVDNSLLRSRPGRGSDPAHLPKSIVLQGFSDILEVRMSMGRIRITLAAAALVGFAAPIAADTLLIDRVAREQAVSEPTQGMDMDTVLARFGEPAQRFDPVGG